MKDNVLVSDTGTPLLTDFGISRLDSASTTGFNTDSVKGSTRWMSYEFFIDKDEDAPPRHNEKTDVWSYGMTVLVSASFRCSRSVCLSSYLQELITGGIPYSYIQYNFRVVLKIAKGELPSEPSFTGSSSDVALRSYMWSICNRCWIKDPKQRPSIAKVLEDMERRS